MIMKLIKKVLGIRDEPVDIDDLMAEAKRVDKKVNTEIDLLERATLDGEMYWLEKEMKNNDI